jgi:hypothetical protein
MYGAIRPLVTLKKGVCIGLFNLLLHVRGAHVCGYSTLATLKRGACMGLFNPLLHLRGVHVWGYSTPFYT